MYYRDLIQQLKPLIGTIIQNVDAEWMDPIQLSAYCGRRVVDVRHLRPAERSDPAETVLIQLEPDAFNPTPGTVGFRLRSRFAQEVAWSKNNRNVRIYSTLGHVATLLLAPSYPHNPVPSSNQRQTDPEPAHQEAQ